MKRVHVLLCGFLLWITARADELKVRQLQVQPSKRRI